MEVGRKPTPRRFMREHANVALRSLSEIVLVCHIDHQNVLDQPVL